MGFPEQPKELGKPKINPKTESDNDIKEMLLWRLTSGFTGALKVRLRNDLNFSHKKISEVSFSPKIVGQNKKKLQLAW